MFRDLKEYQSLQKLYEEKVSKVENINEENVRGANAKPGVNVGNMFKKIGDALKPKPTVGSRSRFNTNKIEVKKEPEYKPVKDVVFGTRVNEVGAKGGGKPSSVFHDTSKGPDVIEPENQSKEFGPSGQPSASEQIKRARLSGKTGSEKAQELAKMRKESGKTIADVKKANTDSMRARAAKRFADFKAKREAKRLARLNKEDYTPYDMVLEYLLSSEQAATIEEANYVMTEMDAETIQGIVEEQKKNLSEVKSLTKLVMKTPLVKLVPATIGTGIVTKMIASKMGQKSGENEIKKSTTPVPMGDGDAKKSNPIKDLIPNIKKRNKALEDAIEKS